MTVKDDPSSPQFYHGTKADLKTGDLFEPGRSPNFGKRDRITDLRLSDRLTWMQPPGGGVGPRRRSRQ